MKNENTNKEAILQKKAKLFLDEKIIAHVKLYNGTWYNGRFFEVGENSAIIHDREDGTKKIYFLEIKSISEYEEEGI
jgi:hypothetical protein